MKLAAWFLFLFAAYVAYLNACNNRRTQNDSRTYTELENDESGLDGDQSSELDDEESIQRKYCKRNTHQLRSGYDDIRNGKFNLSDYDLQDAILILWEKDKKRRADGQYYTDLENRIYHGKTDFNDPMTGPFFRFVKKSVWDDNERKLLKKLFEECDSLDTEGQVKAEMIDKATDNFFNEVMRGDPFKYVIHYLKDKRHPTAMNDRRFDQTVKAIWTTKFKRSQVVAKSTGVRHYFVGESRTGNHGGGKLGLHHWWELVYLQWNGRLKFRGYSPDYQNPRIIALKYDIVLNQAPPIDVNKVLSTPAYSSTMMGTTAGFDIALMTLLFYTRTENHCAEFFLGDCTAVQVVVKSSKQKKTGQKLMGPMFAKAINKSCPLEFGARIKKAAVEAGGIVL